MKVLSKHKDYYDYLVGIYGMDELMVYDRRTKNLLQMDKYVPDIINRPTETKYTFAICNRFFTIYEFKGKMYHTVKELIELDNLLLKIKGENRGVLSFSKWFDKTKKQKQKRAAEVVYKKENRPTDVNKIIRQPVLLLSRNGDFRYVKVAGGTNFRDTDRKEETTWGIPNLKSYGIATYLPAEKLYQDISAFIGWLKDHPEIPNKQTDIEKVKSHGFDTKKSFRHRKE